MTRCTPPPAWYVPTVYSIRLRRASRLPDARLREPASKVTRYGRYWLHVAQGAVETVRPGRVS